MNSYLFYISYIVLMAIVAYMPVYNDFNHIWGPVLAMVVAGIENGLDRLRLYIALFFANTWVVYATTALFGMVGVGIIAYWVGRNSFSWNRVGDAIQFMLQGGVIGVLLRQLSLSVILNSLFGRSARIQRLMLMLGFAVVIWLFPVNSRYGVFQGFYIVGVSIGLVAHVVWRAILHRRYRLSRYGRGVMEMINGELGSLSTDEENAYKLFIKRKRRAFEKLIRKLEMAGPLSPRLRILKAHSLRVYGRYADALQTSENQLDNTDRDTSFDRLFLLQKALALNELGERQKMYDALKESKRLRDDNFLINATLALRMAEELPIENIRNTEESRFPVQLLRDAMLQNTSEASFEVLSDLFGDAIPIRWGFVQDVYGYTLLKAGDFSFSKDLFLNCIEKEPSFSSSYLHLGEWNIAWAARNRADSVKIYKIGS